MTSPIQSSTSGISLQRETIILRFRYWARNVCSRRLFQALRCYCRGHVLDVGGYNFFLTAVHSGVMFDHWTSLEISPYVSSSITDARYSFIYGDACAMSEHTDGSFDTVLSIQVAEHVMEPLNMVKEMARVLKPGGYAIFLLPQTSVLHMAPNHYYNFTRYWSIEAMAKAGLELVELIPIGGWWFTRASHSLHFFFQAFRVKEYHVPEYRRGPLFYVFLPMMCFVELLLFPMSLLLSIADMAEGANNHLVVARKPVAKTSV